MIKESLFADQEREDKLNKSGDVLVTLNQYINFKALADALDTAAPRPSRAKGGRPPYPTELMVRILVIQQLFNLSDDQMEFQLLDRLSFQRFTGLRHSSSIPDSKTLWVFKDRLLKAGASETIFNAVNRQLEQRGYIARCGQLIDATLINVPKQQLRSSEKAALDNGETPSEWSAFKTKQKDSDAKWTKKNGVYHFGYKLSINADNRYKLVRKLHVSPANEHDSQHFEKVIDPSNTSVRIYADRGYTDGARESRLKIEGYLPQIQHKAKKGKPLSSCQAKRNHQISRIRCRVEHVFGAIKQMGEKSLRTIGFERAVFQLHLKVACYNLKRLSYLQKQGIVPLLGSKKG